MRMLIFILSAFVLIGAAKATPIEIQRADGSKIHFYFEKPQISQYPIVIILQGSTCISAWPMAQMVAGNVGQKAGVVAIEKYGLNEGTTICPQEYLENNTVDQRIEDHLEVIEYLRVHASGWNKNLAWAGGSEGGQVAALTAPLVPETKLIAMLASGGGLTMAEELPIAIERQLRRTGSTEEAIHQAKKDLADHYVQIKSNPTWKAEWMSNGNLARNTYKWWNSILWKKALPLLEQTDALLYIAHGTEDTSCPIESSDLIAQRFQALGKANLTYKRYSGLEHNWSDLSGNSHTQEVLRDAFSWIFQNLKQSASK